MLIRLAWKNIWRNKRRSLIMIVAIMMGLWGGLFAAGIFTGMYDSIVSTSINRDLAHLQVHAPGFREERLLSMSLASPDSIEITARALPGVTGVSPRILVDGMASSTVTAAGVRIVGIDPSKERATTAIADRVREGSFFAGTERLPILVGKKLVEKLGLRMRSKLVLSFQRRDGTIMYGAFRVAGIFDTESTPFDGTTVLVRNADLSGLLGEHPVHEIAVRLSTNDSLLAVQAHIASAFPGSTVETWKELAPELKLSAESADVTAAVFLGIILLALLFGVTNTMLMSVLDRVREFGMLMAVGMKRRRLFGMIMLETLLLSLTGSLAGTVLGALTLAWAGHRGIDLAWFSEGLTMYGMSSMLYPAVHAVLYPALGAMVVVASVLAALYPATKAVRLVPSAALSTFG
jgi:ABC-type lipoprotein release transport system permease subunit